MKLKKAGVFITTSLVMSGIFFAVRALANLFFEETESYVEIAVWAILTGVLFTALDAPMKKTIRKISVAMHGEEKVRDNERHS